MQVEDEQRSLPGTTDWYVDDASQRYAGQLQERKRNAHLSDRGSVWTKLRHSPIQAEFFSGHAAAKAKLFDDRSNSTPVPVPKPAHDATSISPLCSIPPLGPFWSESVHGLPG
uniref:(northern house mosquito) hypothetical protein n=1 Tax=Culex pipiens TaxID=7175 RepID=A0A8D8FG78_CULPI